MSKEQNNERRGLGKVVYSVDSEAAQDERRETDGTDEVQEASEESFPASDPPGYTRGAADEMAAEPLSTPRRPEKKRRRGPS